MQEKDLREIFESVELFEFDSPTTRLLFDKKFSTESLPIELYARTKIFTEATIDLKENEFLSCLSFESSQRLFHFNNNFCVPDSLLDLAKGHISELIFSDVKKLLTENLESENFIQLFDKLFEICSTFGQDKILEEILSKMYDQVGWSKNYEELSHSELNLISCLFTYLCKWASRLPTIAPNVSSILSFCYENDLTNDAVDVKAEIAEFIDKIEDMTSADAQSGIFSSFLPSVFGSSTPNKHLYDELREELKLVEPESEVVSKFKMDLDLSLIDGIQLQKISSSLMNISKTEFNIFYPALIYNLITSNTGEACYILLESLPIYITNCLAFPEKPYISEYEELKFKIQKYYI